MKTSALVKSALLAALTAVAAQIMIPQPFSSVPLTLQVFFPLLAGAVLGPVYGALSQIIYVLMGAIGLPVFAGGGSGIGSLIGPTGGYLFGFIIAAYVVGLITIKGKGSIANLVLAMSAGVLVIYVLGVFQLSIVSKMSILKAIVAGALPFIVFDFIKAFVAVVVARRIGLATKE
ncbi:MAG: biotin transporter BioY [Actinomycetota bacterium]